MSSPRPTPGGDQVTAPQRVVPVRATPAARRQAARDLDRALVIRDVLAGLAAVVLIGAAVRLWGHGTRVDPFPVGINGATTAPLTHFSPPWLAAGALAALLAGLVVISVIADVVRVARWRQERGRITSRSAPARLPADTLEE